MLEFRVPADGQLTVPMAWDDFDRWSSETDLPFKVEWYDGLCVMTSPVRRHSVMVSGLFRLLVQHLRDDLAVLAEAAWSTADGFFLPDLLVCRHDAPGDPYLTGMPLLVVEVLSPSTRTADLTVKREHYAAAGLDWYWVADPVGASLSVFHTVGDELALVQTITATDEAPTVGPFPIVVAPGRLVRCRSDATG